MRMGMRIGNEDRGGGGMRGRVDASRNERCTGGSNPELTSRTEENLNFPKI